MRTFTISIVMYRLSSVTRSTWLRVNNKIPVYIYTYIDIYIDTHDMYILIEGFSSESECVCLIDSSVRPERKYTE